MSVHPTVGDATDLSQFDEVNPFVRSRAADVYFQSVSRNRITLQILERILGSLEVANLGEVVTFRRPQQRALVAALA